MCINIQLTCIGFDTIVEEVNTYVKVFLGEAAVESDDPLYTTDTTRGGRRGVRPGNWTHPQASSKTVYWGPWRGSRSWRPLPAYRYPCFLSSLFPRILWLICYWLRTIFRFEVNSKSWNFCLRLTFFLSFVFLSLSLYFLLCLCRCRYHKFLFSAIRSHLRRINCHWKLL